MRVKIFQETGQLGIDNLEKKMNKWLDEQDNKHAGDFSVIDIKVSQSGGGVPDDEIFQCLTVIVMFQLRRGNY